MERPFDRHEGNTPLHALFAIAADLTEKHPEKVACYPISEAHVAEMEQRMGFSAPAELKDFWLSKGFFDFMSTSLESVEGAINTCYVYGYNDNGPWFQSLFQLLPACLYGDVSIDQSLLQDERDFFEFACYGCGFVASNIDGTVVKHIYFITAAGSSGVLRIEETTGFDLTAILRPLLTSKAAAQALIDEKKAARDAENAYADSLPLPDKTPSLMDFVKGIDLAKTEKATFYPLSLYDLDRIATTLGFEPPAPLLQFWREHGAFNSWQTPIATPSGLVAAVALYFPGALFLFDSFRLSDFLTRFLKDTPSPDSRLTTEYQYLNDCFYVYGMLQRIVGECLFCEVFYIDALGGMDSLRFRYAEQVKLEEEIDILLARRDQFEAFMQCRAQQADAMAHESEHVQAATDSQELPEQVRRDLFLKQHSLEIISYQEACQRLNIDTLFAANEDRLSDYDTDEEYWRYAFPEVFFHEGNLLVEGDFRIPGSWSSHILLVVNGDLIVKGHMSTSYYVTGNASFDVLHLSEFQFTGQQENIIYLAEIIADDDEMLREHPARHINAPYFFSWFYDLNSFSFAPHTCITAMYNYDDLQAYDTPNLLFMWHDYAFAFKPEFYFTLEKSYHDAYTWNSSSIYEALKAGRNLFIEGFNAQCFADYQAGLRLAKVDDHQGAFMYFKRAIAQCPDFSLALDQAGQCLRAVKAYQQAIPYFKRCIEVFPERVKYPDLGCLTSGAICALALGDADTATFFANQSLQRDEKNAFAKRVLAELDMREGRIDNAKKRLEESIAEDGFFSNHWLLGLICHREGLHKRANELFKIAKRHNAQAAPFTEHDNLAYVYGTPITVDWEQQSLNDTREATKDQAYWEAYFERRKNGTVRWGIPEALQHIPLEARTQRMLEHYLARHDERGNALCAGDILSYFDPSLITQTHVESALQRETPCKLDSVPERLRSRQVYLQVPYLSLDDVPEEYKDYNFYLAMVRKSYRYYEEVPLHLRDEKMGVAAIVGGLFDKYSRLRLPEKFYQNSMIKQAIDMDLKTLAALPASRVDLELYDHAQQRYGHTQAWKALVAQHDRDYWQHTHNGKPFDYNTLDNVWACFWDEDYLIQALQGDGDNSRAKLHDIPAPYITQRMADVAVELDSYNFCAVPREFMHAALCEAACSRGYGSAIEYVPVTMRTARVCRLAVNVGYDNYRFVPKHLRTVELSMLAITRDMRQLSAVPYEVYVELFTLCMKQQKNSGDHSVLHYLRGVGYFHENRWNEAIEDFRACRHHKKVDDVHRAKSLYMEGWCHFKQGNHEQAEAFLQDAKNVRIEELKEFLVAYQSATLPPVFYSVTDFSRSQFNDWMRRAEDNIKARDYALAMTVLDDAEALLRESQCSEMAYWAYVWDFRRYALYEMERFEEWSALCRHAIAELSKIQLWDYLEEFNPIRSALRAMHNALAHECCQKATSLEEIKEGLSHSKTCFATLAPIESDEVLHPFYETRANLLHRAAQMDARYQTEFDNIMGKIRHLGLEEAGMLSPEFVQRFLQTESA